jgi:hypothetical protein
MQANHRVLPHRRGQQVALTPCATRNTRFAVAQGVQRVDPTLATNRNLLVWTAPDGIERARMRSLQTSDKGNRPWNKLAELGWTRRSTFSSFTG